MAFNSFINPYNPYQVNPYFNNGFTNCSSSVTGNLIKVNGFKSVEEYPLGPNCTQAFFHAEENIFWIKETDVSCNPKYRKFRYTEEAEGTGNPDYVTREEFNELKELIVNGAVPIPDQTNTTTSEQG